MVLLGAWHEYLSNIKIAVAFLVLGLFVFFFILFANAFFSSGSVFFEYSLLKSGFFVSVFEIAVLLVYLLVFSTFLSVIIFSVRHDLNEVRMQHYLIEKLPKFVSKIFLFLLLLSAFAIVASSLLVFFEVPTIASALLMFIFSVAFFFVPQAIVIDEERIVNAVLNSLHFLRQNKKLSAFVFFVSAAIIFPVPLLEIAFDGFSFSGRFVSIIFVLAFALPFIEVLKTVVYLTKFDLIKSQL